MQGSQEDAIGPWVLGTVMGLLSLFGLALASAAEDTVFYGTGLALFLFGVLFIFGLIHQRVGRHAHGQDPARALAAGRRR